MEKSSSLPDAPPVIPPQEPVTGTSSATAAVESSRNPNPTHKENGCLPQGQSPDLSAKPRRESSRKRTRPQFYGSLTEQQHAASPRCSDRPPKAPLKPLFPHDQQPQKGNVNEASSTPLGRQPYNDRVGQETNMYGKTCNVSIFQAQVDENLACVLEAINRKHGDIAQDCSLESHCMKTLVLLGICKVVQDLREKRLKDIDICYLDTYYAAVRDAENMKVNVHWLHSRLDEIKDAVNLSNVAKEMVNERNTCLENIGTRKKELALHRAELERLTFVVREIKELLTKEVVMVEELNKKLSEKSSKISQFQHIWLMDGLI